MLKTILQLSGLLVLFFILQGFSGSPSEVKKPSFAEASFKDLREKMVSEQIIARGIGDSIIIRAMRKVPRHLFVGKKVRDMAYEDHPLPIGEGQTISQPYVVALMTEALGLGPSDRVLEVGTGSGYQAAVLAEIVDMVYTIEIRKNLEKKASALFERLGYENIETKYGDGYYGWEEHAPFDAVIVTASANHIPPPLMKQLSPGGKLIIPLGNTLYYQTLTLVTKENGDIKTEQIGGVAFVPMTGKMRE